MLVRVRAWAVEASAEQPSLQQVLQDSASIEHGVHEYRTRLDLVDDAVGLEVLR